MFKKMFNDRSSRNIIFFVATLIVVAMIIVAVTSNLPLKTFAEGEKTGEDIRRILNVFGNGKVTVEPDIAYIILGVVTEHENAAMAQKENAAAMDKLISNIKAAGIKEEDIKTTNYSIYPKYNYIRETGEQQIIGYTVNNSIQLTIRDTLKVGKLLTWHRKAG